MENIYIQSLKYFINNTAFNCQSLCWTELCQHEEQEQVTILFIFNQYFSPIFDSWKLFGTPILYLILNFSIRKRNRGGKLDRWEKYYWRNLSYHFPLALSMIFPRSKQCNGMENVYSLISLNSNIFWWSAAVPSNISGLAGLALISRLLLINIVKINSPNTLAKYHPGLFKYSYGLFKQQTDGMQTYNNFRSDSTQYKVKLLNDFNLNG